jgi:hypothetical protein
MNSMITTSLERKNARVSFKRQRWNSRKEKEGERRTASSRRRGDGLGDVLAMMGGYGGVLAEVRDGECWGLVCPSSARERGLWFKLGGVEAWARIYLGGGAIGHRLAWRSMSGRGGRRACLGVRRQGEEW